jgi:membrane-associated phospholipid phosphatase
VAEKIHGTQSMIRFIFFQIFFVLTLFSHSQNGDVNMLKSFNGGEMPVWDKTMRGVSFSVYPVMPVSVGSVWIHGYATKNDVLMRNAYKGALSIALASGISTGLKYAIGRKRPFVDHPNDITQRDHVGPYSFPSGHTTVAFATATAMSLSYKKWYVVVPSYVYAGFVGYSRMRLGVHYPSDVLGGIFVGVGSGFLMWGLDKWINGK